MIYLKDFKYKLLIVIVLLACIESCRKNSDNEPTEIHPFEDNQGVFEYTLYEPLKDKPFSIHFYIPNNVDKQSAPILFVFPGMNRNADDYLDAWINLADQYNVMVFSFEFSNSYYPGSISYQQGYIVDDDGNLMNEEAWTFSAIEPVFDFIKSELDYQLNYYNIFGHSGGAQFVHRYIQFKPLSRVSRAVAANSGWYTLPDTSVAYPYGLKNTGLNSIHVENSFQKQLEIHLGQNDNDPNDPSLRKTPEANLQGLHRLDRGRYFIQKSDTISNSLNVNLNWIKKEVPNVAHDYQNMSIFAADELF